jgi:uncharacterized membrane protein
VRVAAPVLVLGLVAIVWYAWFRDTPAEKGVPADELAELGHVPPRASNAIRWSLALRQPSMWGLIAMDFCYLYTAFFTVFWLPTYLVKGRGFTNDELRWTAVIWVGGMFFAYIALRPAAAALLQPQQRLPLWQETFHRFFFWVWLSVGGLLVSGLWMIVLMVGFRTASAHIHLMLLLGIVMIAIFVHVYFAPYRRLTRMVGQQDWKAAGAALGQIRTLVGVNRGIGLVNIAVGTLGRLFA